MPPKGGQDAPLPAANPAARHPPAVPRSTAGLSNPPKLLDRLRTAIRVRHYSRRTERSYVGWVRRFILFHKKRHPAEMGAAEVQAFLNHLAVQAKVSAATQNQALCAISFLYRNLLEMDLPWLDGLERARRPQRLPVVLTSAEAASYLRNVDGTAGIMVSLLYGSGLRLLECCRLRVKDIDLDKLEVTVRDGKGSTPAQTASGLGSGSFRQRDSTPSPKLECGGGIICTRRSSSGRFGRRR